MAYLQDLSGQALVCRVAATPWALGRVSVCILYGFTRCGCDNRPSKNLKVPMAKKAPAVVAPPPEAARTKPLQIPDTGFKTIWQVVGAPPVAAKTKSEKSATSA